MTVGSVLQVHLAVLPILLPLLTATLALAWPRASRPISLLGALAVLAASMALVLQAAGGVQTVYLLGNWQAPFGIALMADHVSAWALLATAWVLFGVLVFSIGGAQDEGAFFHPLFHVLWMGVNGAFLTADVFNLFVFFEVMLVGSYGLALQGASGGAVGASLRYVAINLAGSALFLIAAGVLYGVSGTLSFADLAVRLPQLPAADRPLAVAGVGLLSVVFLLKAAALPLSAWLPQTYGRIAPVSAAAFTLLTKLGAYGLLRLMTLWGGALGDWPLAGIVLACGAGTLLLAGFGALASLSLTQVATWSVLSSSGFLMLVFASASPQAAAAGLLYLPASAVCASALFLVADLQRRNCLGASRLWLLAAAAGVAGLPPFATFIAKLQALDGVLASPVLAWMALVILLGGLLSVVGLARVGLRVSNRGGKASLSEQLALAWLCGGALLLSVCAGPAQRYVSEAVTQMATPDAYIQAVLGQAPMRSVP
ncbi:proton-conducting transporter membrane subunit [Niveibacterium sp. 24ML]|uniref:proton-conducting transporter transmembrane domain-containing protein n=1 Tax=Niveibacterium sp. 24ML TaxID=2985512 RepID=UPI00226D4956|nr:proton-conducting transporter membrane subunit [Niveibacterium sp. 24ML]MCX9157978.1 proton-conducting transporter membrane subunit [Niveibacterium sp. 24ML]